jgi:hypothetical protein
LVVLNSDSIDPYLNHVGQRLSRRSGKYGLLTLISAIGTVAGEFLAAGRAKHRTALLLAAPHPNHQPASPRVFTTTANSTVQLSIEPISSSV